MTQNRKNRKTQSKPSIRVFASGANRDADDNKLDYEGFLSPAVLNRYAEYMHKHRQLPNGLMRDSDNWQRGIPRAAYMKSAWRHFMEWFTAHRGGKEASHENEDAICALIFNAMGYLSTLLKDREYAT